jgi:tyrosine-specific transport protein
MKLNIKEIFLVLSLGIGITGILPLVVGCLGFIPALLTLLFVFLLMTYANLLLVESKLWFPPYTDIAIIADKMIGKPFGIITRCGYIGFFYFLFVGYLSEGILFVENILFSQGADVWQRIICVVPWLLVVASIMYLVKVRFENIARIFTILALLLLFLAFNFAGNDIQPTVLTGGSGDSFFTVLAFMVLVFPIGMLVNKFKIDYKNDSSKITRAVLLGGITLMFLTAVWLCLIFSLIPQTAGWNYTAFKQASIVQILLEQLTSIRSTVGIVAGLFLFSVLISSFILLLSLLREYYGHRYSIKHNSGVRLKLVALMKVVPKYKLFIFSIFSILLVVVAVGYPERAFEYFKIAGLLLIIFGVILPALIVYCGRYFRDAAFGYRVAGGRFGLIVTMLLGILIFCLAL